MASSDNHTSSKQASLSPSLISSVTSRGATSMEVGTNTTTVAVATQSARNHAERSVCHVLRDKLFSLFEFIHSTCSELLSRSFNRRPSAGSFLDQRNACSAEAITSLVVPVECQSVRLARHGNIPFDSRYGARAFRPSKFCGMTRLTFRRFIVHW